MRSLTLSAVMRRAPSAAAWVVLELLAPLAVTVAVILFLADPAHVDVSELRANTLLLNARPIFRVIAPQDQLRVAIGDSLLLLGAAIAGAVALGVPSGIAYAWSRNGPLKTIAWSAGVLASSLPAFFWAVLLELGMVVIFFKTGERPLPAAGFGVDEHIVLPALALGLRPAAYMFRLTGTAVDEVRHTDYVRTAIAKGANSRIVLVRHVLPNTLPSIAGAIVLGARVALSSLLIVEYVYVWGGAGSLFIQSLARSRLQLAAELALAFAIGSAVLAVAAEAIRARARVGR